MSKQAIIVCATVALTLCVAPSTAAPRSRHKDQAIFENLSRIMAKTYHPKEVRWPGYNRVIDSLIYDYAEDAVTNLHEKMEMLPSDGRAVSQILKLVILNDTEDSKYQEVEEMLEDVEQIEFERLDKFFNFWRDKAKAIVKLYYEDKQQSNMV